MAISEELELDISGALDAIESLNEPLTALGENLTITLTTAIEAVDVQPLADQLAAIDAAGLTTTIDASIEAADGTVPIDADTSAVPGEIDSSIAEADTTVTLEADVSDFGGSIDEALAAADTTIPIVAEVGDIGSEIETEIQSADTTIVIEADTGALDDIAGASGEATTGLEGVTGASGDLQAAASGNLGAGALGGLTSQLAKAGPIGIAGAAGLGVFTAGVKTLFDLAVPALATQQRFNATFGELAKQADKVNLGGLNTNLRELAILLGSDDEELQDAASTLFQFGKASGFTNKQSLDLVNTTAALAARAVALNPALGSVGATVGGLTNAFAKGGKFATKYGLALTAEEIADRARANTGKESNAQLTIQEKAFAGSQIAAERYGASIKKDVTTGSKNAIIEQRRLKVELENVGEEAGKPLVFPIQKFMREILPIVKSLAPVFADLAKDTIPSLAQSLKDAAPGIRVLAETLRSLTPILGPLQKLFNLMFNPLVQIAALKDAFAALGSVFGPVGTAVSDVLEIFGGIPEAIGDAIGSFTGINDAIGSFLVTIVDLGADLIDSFLVGIQEAFPAVVNFFASVGGTILTTIGDVVGTLTQKGTDFIQGLLSGLATKVVEVLKFFTGLPGRIVTAVGPVLGTLVQKGVDLIGGLLSGLATKVVEVFNFFRGLPGRLVDAVGNVVNRMVRVGESIVQGIINGIKNKAKSLAETVENFIVKQIKRIPIIGGLIGSPSPFFTEVGQAIGEGMAIGIKDNASLAIAQMDKLASAITAVPVRPAALMLPAVAATVPLSGGTAGAAAAGPVTSAQADLAGAGAGVHIGQLIVQTAAKDQTQVGIEVSRQLRAESFRAGR